MLVFILIAIIISSVMGVVAIIYLDKQKRSKKKKGYGGKKSLIGITTYYRAFRYLDNFFLTRGGFRRVSSKLSELSVYTSQEIKVISVKFYVTAMVLSGVLLLSGIIIFKDLFSFLLVLTYAIIMKTTLVDKQIDGVHFKLLKQLSIALSSVRQCYLRLGSIPDAIAEAEVGPLLQRSFEDIYLILTSTDGESRLEEFYASTPFKMLQTFAGVCYILNNSGDTKLRDGTSNFIQAMGMMSSEVNLDIRRITLQKAKFGMLEILPLAPLAGIGVIQSFFGGIIPGTSIIYKGALGYLSRTIIVIFSIIGYTTIVKVNSAVTLTRDDRNPLIVGLLSNPIFSSIVDAIKPKKLKKLLKKNRSIKGALSMTDIRHMYGMKVVFSTTVLIVSIISAFLMVDLGKSFVYENVAEISLIGGENLSAKDIEIRKKMDSEYLAKIPKLSNKATTDMVSTYLPKLPEYDKQAQVTRLQRKYDLYYGSYFKWWMLLICYGLATIAWFIPEMFLKARAWLIKTESEEDVLQLQTTIAILMNTSTDTLGTLYWMERQSRVHKNALLDAYHEYPSNPELALDRLKAKAALPEFKRMIDKLVLTIHQITLAEAFSDLVSEREHVMRIREISQNTTLNKKRSMVSPLSMAPLVLTAILYILVPLGILGFQEFKGAMSNIGL